MSELKYINRQAMSGDSIMDYISYEDKTVPVIKYKVFDKYDEVVHGFSTRLGGVSKNHLYSMNLSFFRDDEYENVLENHRIFAGALGYDYRKLVLSDQVHKTDIYVVCSDDAGKGIIGDKERLRNIDGLVTNERDIPLMTFYADCVPLYFYDPVRHVVGLAHSGWRGTVADIAKAMLDKMHDVYGSSASDIICAIGPSICVDCYEVSEDVASEFRNHYNDEMLKDILFYKGNGKYQLDLHQACRYNLLSAGVKAANISMPDYCTCCNPDIFFSHRKTNGMRGNLAAVIMLKA